MARGEVVYFDHEGSDCKDRYHRRCTGRWRGELNIGKDGQGKRRRRKVSAKSKAELLDKLDDLRGELDQGVRSSRSYTVTQAVDEWLAGPMADRAPKTLATQREILAPLTSLIGKIALRDLTADDVSKALKTIAATRSTRTVRDTRAALVRVITYAQVRGKVGRNVAALIKAPAGKAPGRPSKALTVTQALAVLKAAEEDRLYAYFVLSLLTGVRIEEARALRWDHVELDVPVPYVAVWPSVRAGGDVKTRNVPKEPGPARACRGGAFSAPGEAGRGTPAGSRAVAGERPCLQDNDRRPAGRGQCAAIVPADMQGGQYRGELDASRASPQLRLDHVGQRRADRAHRGPGRPRRRQQGH